MKVNLDLKNDKVNKQNTPSFEGYKFVKSEKGFRQLEVAYPYDEANEKCYLEIYKLDTDDKGNYFTTGRAYSKAGHDKYEMNPGANRIDLAKEFGIDDNEAFAYHFLVVDRNGFVKTRLDAGDVIDERNTYEQQKIFNVVTPTKSNLSRGGSMKLVIIDSQKVGYVYNDKNMVVKDQKLAERGEKGIKTITNKFGGTLAGLEHAIDKGEYDSFNRIISLPIFTDDDFTAHAYWNKNCMQMTSSLGNINNYASLQRKMFAHGLNFVSDGAFVNEGLEGVHFKHLLKWGEDSPYLNWFKASGIKDNPLSLGVFAKNKDFISHKIVNSPYVYVQSGNGHVSIKSGNPHYDRRKPTYIQFFDTRLVTEKERKDTNTLIKTYSKMSTPSVYDLHTHNDSIFPYAFEIDPEVYNKNVKTLNEYNGNKDGVVTLDSPQAARLLSKNQNFVVDGKFESGFDTWEANPDIAKLNFVFSNADNKALKNIHIDERQKEREKIIRGNWQVQDYAVTSGQYWTEKTDDILRLHVAQNIRSIDSKNPSLVYNKISAISDNKILPKTVKADVTKDEIKNVLNNRYHGKRVLSDEDKKSQILEGLMNTPLDSFELGDNIVGVLASPLISKRASVEKEIGVSRYQLYKEGNKNLPAEYKKTYEKMEKIYLNEMSEFATTVLDQVDAVLPADRKLFDGDKVTEYGKYVLPLLTPAIAKYAVIKSLAPDITVAINKDTGELSYDYKASKEVSLQGLGITNPSCPEDEADMLLNSLRKGMKKLDSSADSIMVESIARTIKDTNVQSFKIADLIIDKTQAGLDWRIDAAKDIADMEALRKKRSKFENEWQETINFWQRFTQGVISKNPNAYTVAEITDVGDLHGVAYGGQSRRFPKVSDALSKFQRETGMTSTANYSHFFTALIKMFTKNFEDGSTYGDNKYTQRVLFEQLVQGDGSFIKSGGLDSVIYSYTFIGNHDKPRALHCATMDMSMFHSDLMNPSNHEYRRRAYQIMNNKFLDPISDHEISHFDFSSASPKAIAMADALHPAFIDVLNSYKSKYPELNDQEVYNKAFIPLCKAISDLSQGKFLGKRFDADAFGIKPIDITIAMVLKQAKDVHGFSMPRNSEVGFEKDVFEKAMKPALSKLLAMMKFLVALPGMPTIFDGDDVGATGYETKSKNVYVQCRQRVHDEWLDNTDDSKYRSIIAKYKKYFDATMAVRKNPKCNALNNGAVYTLPLQVSNEGVQVPAIFRQSTDGKMAISVLNTSALHYDYRREYKQDDIVLDSIKLNFESQKDEFGNDKDVIVDGDNGVGICGLKNGTKFINANNENDVYVVNELDGKYYLKSTSGDGKIRLTDSTLILYSVPKNSALTFTGSFDFKPSSRLVAGAYKTNDCECGKKLAIVK